MEEGKSKTRPGRNGGTLTNGGAMPGAGRPRKLVTTVIAGMLEIGILEVKDVDVARAYKVLLNCTALELKNVAQSEDNPFLLRSVAKQMLSGKGQEMINKMLDRAYGKEKQQLDLDVNQRPGDVVIVRIPDNGRDNSPFDDAELDNDSPVQDAAPGEKLLPG